MSADNRIVPQQGRSKAAEIVRQLNQYDPEAIKANLVAMEERYPHLRISAAQRLARMNERARLIGNAMTPNDGSVK